MAATRLDQIATTLTTTRSRRGTLRLLAGAALGLVGVRAERAEESAAAPVGTLTERVTRTIALKEECAYAFGDSLAYDCPKRTLIRYEGVLESVELICGPWPHDYPDATVRYSIHAHPPGEGVHPSGYGTRNLRVGQSSGIIRPQDFSPPLASVVVFSVDAYADSYGLGQPIDSDLPFFEGGWLGSWEATLKITTLVSKQAAADGPRNRRRKKRGHEHARKKGNQHHQRQHR